MAKRLVLKNADIELDQNNVSGQINQINLSYSRELLDTTTSSKQGGRSKIAGLKDWEASLGVYIYFDEDGIDQKLFNLVGKRVPLEITFDKDNGKGYQGSAMVRNYKPVSNSVGEVVGTVVQLTGLGALEQLFDIKSLFQQNQNGIWLDSTYNNFLYIEETGITLADEEDVIGLALERSKNALANLGSILIPNYDFSDGTTGWETFGQDPNPVPFSVTDGIATYTRPAGQNSPSSGAHPISENRPSLSGFIFAEIRYRLVSGANAVFNPFWGGGNNLGSLTTHSDFVTQSGVAFRDPNDGDTSYRPRIYSTGGDETVVEIDFHRDRIIPGNHFRQPTTASRPRRKKDSNGNWYLEFDGSDDYLISPGFIQAQPFTYIVAINLTELTLQRIVAGIHDTDERGLLSYIAASNTFRMFSGSSVDSETINQTGKYIISAVFNGANSKIRVNQGSWSTGDAGSRDITEGVHIGTNAAASGEFFAGHLYQGLIREGALTDDQIKNIENEFARKAGIKL